MAALQTAGKRPDNVYPHEGASWKDLYNIPAGTDTLVNLEVLTGNGKQFVFGVTVSGLTAAQAQLFNSLPTGSLIVDPTNKRIIFKDSATTWTVISGVAF